MNRDGCSDPQGHNPVTTTDFDVFCSRCGVIMISAKSEVTPYKVRRKSGTTSKKMAVIKRYGRDCWYCSRRTIEPGVNIDLLDYTIDHVIPVSRGGTNVIENLRPCCRQCNNEKADLLLEEWVNRWYMKEKESTA